MASPLPLAASTNSELNLKAIFRPGRFRDAHEWQVLFLVWILFQWELDESIRLHVLLLLLYRELLHVLLDVKRIVDLFLSFVESFSWLDR